MGHSIARLSPRYCRDRYRWASLGWTESQWWDQHVFQFHCADGPINTALGTATGLLSLCPQWLIHALWCRWGNRLEGVWGWVWVWLGGGWDTRVLAAARNPGFYDPWCPEERTLENPAYGGLFKAKLDWTLVRECEVVEQGKGNTTYMASDHAYLWIRVVPALVCDGTRREFREKHGCGGSGRRGESRGCCVDPRRRSDWQWKYGVVLLVAIVAVKYIYK
ncbi:hypothetical protein BDF14DRAFT_977091 [Spinellus fusiger]|nr:hypothetical protein BDF14DRAFT_977091 [Spinellus fusiger]